MFKSLLLSLTALSALSLASAQETPPAPADPIAAAPDSAWREIPAEELLVFDLPAGPLYIQLQPEMAPAHVERIRTLTRRGFYDGLVFHRVIEGFVAQGGDPTGTGRGNSDLPDLEPEFAQDAGSVSGYTVIGRDDRAAQVGFFGTVPVGTQAPTLPKFLARDGYGLWGLHCQGVLSMARAQAPDSANSQFFILFGDARDSLDQGYTVWGNVVGGYINARRISRGEPPVRPTPIVRARMMSDMPADERKRIEYLDPASDAFSQWLTASGNVTANGFVPNMCGIDVPVRIDGEVTE